MAKRTKTSRTGRSRDRKLVAGRQKHEVRYTAKKAGVKGRTVKKAVKRIGSSRRKVEQVLRRRKRAVKRVPTKAVEAPNSATELSSSESSGSEST
jgi:uncharacterized protein DUF3606